MPHPLWMEVRGGLRGGNPDPLLGGEAREMPTTDLASAAVRKCFSWTDLYRNDGANEADERPQEALCDRVANLSEWPRNYPERRSRGSAGMKDHVAAAGSHGRRSASPGGPGHEGHPSQGRQHVDSQ